MFVLNPGGVQVGLRPAPEWVQEIIAMPTDALKKLHEEIWMEGASDRRMTMHTELVYRGESTY